MKFLSVSDRIKELEEKKSIVEQTTQTAEQETKEDSAKEEKVFITKYLRHFTVIVLQHRCPMFSCCFSPKLLHMIKFKFLCASSVCQILQAASEVENLKSQMMTLFKELQQAQSKLDEAEGMKKNLQDRLGPHTRTHY